MTDSNTLSSVLKHDTTDHNKVTHSIETCHKLGREKRRLKVEWQDIQSDSAPLKIDYKVVPILSDQFGNVRNF